MGTIVDFVDGLYVKEVGVMKLEDRAKVGMVLALEIYSMREEYLEGKLGDDISSRLEVDGYMFAYEGNKISVSRGMKLALGAKEFDHNKFVRSMYKEILKGVECNG